MKECGIIATCLEGFWHRKHILRHSHLSISTEFGLRLHTHHLLYIATMSHSHSQEDLLQQQQILPRREVHGLCKVTSLITTHISYRHTLHIHDVSMSICIDTVLGCLWIFPEQLEWRASLFNYSKPTIL